MMTLNSLKGTKDIFWPEIEIWRHLEDISRQIFNIYSYREIRTPIIEYTSLFARSIGKSTDIIQKEMYSFKDKGQRQICLRPEETASVVRSYIQHGALRRRKVEKLFYIGPMFRSERPQAGRMRQFHQIGVESIGSRSPLMDAEIMLLLNEILSKSKVKNYTFKINNLGCDKCQPCYKNILKKTIKPHLGKLCSDCKKRYNLNVLRILDCKNESCTKIISNLPIMADYLCPDCKQHFEKLRKLIGKFKIPSEIDTHLVRGLDYYTGATFEVVAKNLGAKDAVAAGGRYDKLVEELGGFATAACGFAIGIERLISSIDQKDKDDLAGERRKSLFIYVVCLDEKTRLEGFEILSELRKNNICAEMDYSGAQCPSLKSQMRQANNLGAKYVIIIGEDEIREKVLTIKNMESGKQEKIAQDKLVHFFNKTVIKK